MHKRLMYKSAFYAVITLQTCTNSNICHLETIRFTKAQDLSLISCFNWRQWCCNGVNCTGPTLLSTGYCETQVTTCVHLSPPCGVVRSLMANWLWAVNTLTAGSAACSNEHTTQNHWEYLRETHSRSYKWNHRSLLASNSRCWSCATVLYKDHISVPILFQTLSYIHLHSNMHTPSPCTY